MTYEESIKRAKEKYPEDKTFVFDYYRSSVNNTFSNKACYILSSKTSHASFAEKWGKDDNYQSSDLFDDNSDEIHIFIAPLISDYETLLDGRGNFDRDKAIRYVE